jgi:putative membrane protein
VKADVRKTASVAVLGQPSVGDIADVEDEGDVMRSAKWMSAGCCAGLLWAAAPVFAETVSHETAETRATAPGDGAFLTRALGVNQLELTLGQMAVRRGTTPEVRAMGERMVKRHTEISRQLRELAGIDRASAPPTLSPDRQKTLATLEAVPYQDFDKVFKNTVSAGHIEELAMYREEVSHADDPRLAALAKGRVVALEQSMAMANPAPSVPAAKRAW